MIERRGFFASLAAFVCAPFAASSWQSPALAEAVEGFVVRSNRFLTSRDASPADQSWWKDLGDEIVFRDGFGMGPGRVASKVVQVLDVTGGSDLAPPRILVCENGYVSIQGLKVIMRKGPIDVTERGGGGINGVFGCELIGG